MPSLHADLHVAFHCMPSLQRPVALTAFLLSPLTSRLKQGVLETVMDENVGKGGPGACTCVCKCVPACVCICVYICVYACVCACV